MKKLMIAVGALLLTMFLMAGCGTVKTPEEPAPVLVLAEPAEQVILYAYDAEEQKSYNTVCELSQGQEISVENVVTAYQSQVISGVYNQTLAINSMVVENGSLYLDFNAEDVGNLQLESGTEGNFFGDLARTIEANLPTIEQIFYTMDGEDLVIGHLMFSKDEPFWYGVDVPQE